MASNCSRILVLTLMACLCAGALSACDRTDDPAQQPAEPWHFRSEQASYAVEVPGQWKQLPADRLNQYADLTVSLDERFYLIVIPQKLPSFEGVPSPDARALKRASVRLLQERVDSFSIEKEGPVTLADEPALSVFAEGLDDNKPVQYINTYATRGQWGYQIVAWGPKENEEGLIAATDALLDGWRFTDAADQQPGSQEADSSESAPGPDAADN